MQRILLEMITRAAAAWRAQYWLYSQAKKQEEYIRHLPPPTDSSLMPWSEKIIR